MKRTKPRVERLLLIGLLLACLVGCSAGPEPEPEAWTCTDCNVVFIMLDTLRADHLGIYGYERPTSPTLDAFGSESITFWNARSQSSCTFPSVNSLLTSKYIFPFLEAETRPGVPDGMPYLPEILKQRGYSTAAISASPIVRSEPGKFNPVGGFGRGFDQFDESCEWHRGNCVNRRAFETLDQTSSPFFLYLHYIDVHDPYNPPETVRGTFSKPYEGEHEFVRDGDPNPIQKLIREGGADILDETDFQHLVDLYDEELILLDGYLQTLFDELEKRALLEKTIIVITSDHGEEFYEHGLVKHCGSVYDTETRVPLMIQVPGLGQTGIRSQNVENVDVVPTLLDYLGIPMEPDWDFAGTSLRQLIEDDVPIEGAHSFSAMGVLRSINNDRHKLIYHLGNEVYRLYDLEADPEEQENILLEERRTFRDLQDRLLEWSREQEGETDVDDRLKTAEEVEEQLRSLGYLG